MLQSNTTKLPISVGILAWHSGQVLVDTLTTYYNNGLLNMVNDVTILFQEVTEEDIKIASHFGIDCIGLHQNIGIGKAFKRLTENAQSDYVLILEHDWNLIENEATTFIRLQKSISAIEMGMDVVRLRHRREPGHPHFSFQYKGKELTYYDDWHEVTITTSFRLMTKLIIFDLDGVLVEAKQIHYDTLNKALKEIDEEQICYY
jgi:phage anti-repressor protein